MTNFSDMLSKAKAMQEKMKEAQDQIKKIEVEGEAGGNLVKVKLSGDYEIKSIIISDAAKKENQDLINDLIIAAYNNSKENLKIVTKRQPSEQELDDLLFAFKVAKHVKSNAIVYAKDGSTVGIGAGQMNRLDSSRIAARKSDDAAKMINLEEPLAVGSVVASDAFFPFADGLMAAADAGVTAIIQPGGSIRDDEVIEAANNADLAMLFTGIRHFNH